MIDGVVKLTYFTQNDAPILMEGDHDPEHRRWFDFPDDFIPTLAHAEGVIARWEQERLAGTRFPFAVREVTTDTLWGGCEIQPREDKTANLSYWTYPLHRGKGVATHAALLGCQWAFATLAVSRVEIVAHPDNTASRRVATRCGFREVGMREKMILYTLDSPQNSDIVNSS
jgi:RimJ/RimL family protein N-acetyltransferase